jgi:hypothetical protein
MKTRIATAECTRNLYFFLFLFSSFFVLSLNLSSKTGRYIIAVSRSARLATLRYSLPFLHEAIPLEFGKAFYCLVHTPLGSLNELGRQTIH